MFNFGQYDRADQKVEKISMLTEFHIILKSSNLDSFIKVSYQKKKDLNILKI